MTTASITIKEPTHIMGPKGEIIATISPTDNGFALDFDYEPVELTMFAGQFAYRHLPPVDSDDKITVTLK